MVEFGVEIRQVAETEISAMEILGLGILPVIAHRLLHRLGHHGAADGQERAG